MIILERPDGRKIDEMRKIQAKAGVIEKANGSGYFRIGNTIALAAVYGPKAVHPKHLENPERGILRTYYSMYSFSVPERKRPGPDRRAIEIGLVMKNALKPVILLEEYPRTMIDVYVNIIQADAGTRCAAISAASIALADAGIEMKDLVAAVAAGRIYDTVVLDLNKEEEDIEGATDIPMAYSPRLKQFTLLQLDGKIPKEDLKKALELGRKGCEQIYKIQRKALKQKYGEIVEN